MAAGGWEGGVVVGGGYFANDSALGFLLLIGLFLNFGEVASDNFV